MKSWISQPISRTCEVVDKNHPCGLPTTNAYKVMGWGWMALCAKHAVKHLEYAPAVRILIAQDETFKK